MSPRRNRRRRSRTSTTGAGVLLAVMALAAIMLWNWLSGLSGWASEHPLLVVPLGIIAAAGAGALGFLWLRRKQTNARKEYEQTQRHAAHQRAQRTTITGLHDLLPKQFEVAVGDLLKRDGCPWVSVTGGRGDGGVDILAAAPDGSRLAVQCKRYSQHNFIGVAEVRDFDSGARLQRAQRAILVTTTPRIGNQARRTASQAGVELVLRDRLARWAQGARIWDILDVARRTDGTRQRHQSAGPQPPGVPPDDRAPRTAAGGNPQADTAQQASNAPRPVKPLHDDVADDEGRTRPVVGDAPGRPDRAAATPRPAARPPSPPPPAAQPIGHIWPGQTRQRSALDDDGDPHGRTVVIDEREVARRTGWSVQDVVRRLETEALRGERASPQERARTGGEWRVRISDLDAYRTTLDRQQAARQAAHQRQQRQRGLGREREL